ncbi:MAG: DUF4838 domain-containing protein, partial [Sphingobacteriales bacterium]
MYTISATHNIKKFRIFMHYIKRRKKFCNNLFIWEYTVQFTNYVSPFPNLSVLQPNLEFFRLNKVKGVFSQGSGETSGEFSALRGYLLAKLAWNTQADVKSLTEDFLTGYYGKAAPFIQQYIKLLDSALKASGQRLDIYGNPVSVHNTYLSPALLDQYGILFDQAENAVEDDTVSLNHVQTARLPVEFAVLQQSRFYGIEQHGAFLRSENGQWEGRPSIKNKLKFFVQTANTSGITEISEGGLSPDQYAKEWEQIFLAGPK